MIKIGKEKGELKVKIPEIKPFKVNDKYGVRNFQYDGISLTKKESDKKAKRLREVYGRYVRVVKKKVPDLKTEGYIRYDLLNPKRVLKQPKSNLKFYLKGSSKRNWLSGLSDYNFYSLEHLTKYKGKKEGWKESDRKQAIKMFKKAKKNRKKRKNLDFYK